jgi:hypothetical protein
MSQDHSWESLSQALDHALELGEPKRSAFGDWSHSHPRGNELHAGARVWRAQNRSYDSTLKAAGFPAP